LSSPTARGARPPTYASFIIPSTYIVTDEDRTLPVPAQEMFAQRVGDTRHISSSHSPFLSRPADLAAILRDELSRI